MADLPSGFWAGWIAVLTIVSLIGLIWLSLSIYMSREEYKSPVWDENLREGSTPAPLWWFWLMFALLIFSDIYLVLYPGLGSYRGALYVGVTNDLSRRLSQHRLGSTGGFTSRYKVFDFLHFEMTTDVLAAITREKQIKGWTRDKKIRLIESDNPRWADLAVR